MDPIYNRIPVGLGISPELPPQNDSVANSLFSGSFFDPKKVPGPKCQPGDPKIRSWAQRFIPGHETTKDAG